MPKPLESRVFSCETLLAGMAMVKQEVGIEDKPTEELQAELEHMEVLGL